MTLAAALCFGPVGLAALAVAYNFGRLVERERIRRGLEVALNPKDG